MSPGSSFDSYDITYIIFYLSITGIISIMHHIHAYIHTHTSGKGKIVFHPNSSNLEESYEGEWSEDVIHGRGTYKYRREEGEQSRHLSMHA